MRIVGSLCARLIALAATVGKVISNADNVSIVKMIPTVRPATSSTSNLTAVPSVAVSKLISPADFDVDCHQGILPLSHDA